VTKDGSLAGPRVLEHLVDVVCQFDGDRHSRLRLLRATKHRYGPTDEVGCFELSDTGIRGLADPSGLFLSESRTTTVPGTCASVSLEGRRPMPTEIQALVAPSSLSNPRRTTSGLDGSRTAMTLGVLQARLGLDLTGRDVYVSTVGGARAVEPAVDLAVALAVASAAAARRGRPSRVHHRARPPPRRGPAAPGGRCARAARRQRPGGAARRAARAGRRRGGRAGRTAPSRAVRYARGVAATLRTANRR